MLKKLARVLFFVALVCFIFGTTWVIVNSPAMNGGFHHALYWR